MSNKSHRIVLDKTVAKINKYPMFLFVMIPRCGGGRKVCISDTLDWLFVSFIGRILHAVLGFLGEKANRQERYPEEPGAIVSRAMICAGAAHYLTIPPR